MHPLTPNPPGTLYLVATPIGNLEDITLRALRVLSQVDLVASEDTRRTRQLLTHYRLHKPLVSFHEHNEARRTPELLERLTRGECVALVSDAGTPLISDPGQRLVQACRAQGIPVVPIPGPSAPVAALVASGLDTTEFLFIGFLPARARQRQQRLQALLREPRTVICFEAPHRLQATLRELATLAGERRAVIARELTKLHEEFVIGTVRELADRFAQQPPRGEVTLLLEGAPKETPLPSASPRLLERARQLMEEHGLDWKAALKVAAREQGLSRREAYRLWVHERHKA